MIILVRCNFVSDVSAIVDDGESVFLSLGPLLCKKNFRKIESSDWYLTLLSEEECLKSFRV